MSKIKKSILYCLSAILAFSFLIVSFPSQRRNKANAADPPVNEITIIDDRVLNYVSISTADLALTADKLKTVDTNNDGNADTSFIFANGTISLNFYPFEYNYAATFDESLFYETRFTKTIEKPAEGDFPTSFTYKDVEISYQVSADNKFSFKYDKNNNLVSDENSDFIQVTADDTTRTFTFITGYTLKAEAGNTTFSFSASNSAAQLANTKYTLCFERPIVDFKTDYVTHFTCKQLDGGSVFDNEIIERELSFENVKVQFTNNNYTKNNPLYFDINYNGFIYTFTLYSEDDYLFVEYYDDQRNQNNRSLATLLNEDGSINTGISKFKSGSVTDFNMFSIDFNKTGRYEISVYDSTYLLLKKQPYVVIPEDEDPTDNIEPEPEIIVPEDNSFNYNFYQTSFYIKTSEFDSDSAFDNAYVIMQSYDDDGNYLDYIVTTSTQNNNVQVTLKNLAYYFENDEALKNFTATETLPDLNVVQFIKTTLTGSTNIPQSTFYTLSELKQLLSSKKDLNIQCTEDAFYEINIYQYDSVSYAAINKHHYEFTIVKQPKTSFTVYEVDENNDPIVVPDSNPVQFKKIIREADTPYETETINYKININSSMEIATMFCEKLIKDYPVDGLPQLTPTTLPKTYLNEYTIDFAMQAVSIEQAKVNSDEKITALRLTFFGVGDITVTVTVNSVTSTYTVKSGETLQFETIGTYSVHIEDSMGTTGTGVFTLKKPVSMSAIILIVLVGIIVLAVVLFVLSARGKLKTR